jgi:CRP/FNR family cyclic AMP-dependent transcriptional regulator
MSAVFDALLDGLADADRDRLLSSMRTRRLRRGDVLFWEGDSADAAFLIDSGHIIIERTTEDGDVVAVAIVGAGELIGEQALLSDDPRAATTRAVEATELRVLAKSSFDELRHSQPAFDSMLISLLDQRLRSLSDLLLDARHRPVDSRIRRTIRQLYNQFGQDIPLSQEVVASLAGTTRPTANGVVRALQDDGLVQLARGRLKVLDPDSI